MISVGILLNRAVWRSPSEHKSPPWSSARARIEQAGAHGVAVIRLRGGDARGRPVGALRAFAFEHDPSGGVSGRRPLERPIARAPCCSPSHEARPRSVRTADVAAVGGHVVRSFIGGTRLVSVPSGDELSAIETLRSRGHVRFAEPDYMNQEDAVPNDPSFGLQWGDLNTGQPVNGDAGTAGADERSVPAWDVTTGSRSIVIAEVDSGVDYNHPDLAANIWSNPGGVGGCLAGTHGYNVLTPSTCDPMDDETPNGGHGTHVAGILGAVGNNGIGVAGVNWATTILPVKWLDSNGQDPADHLIEALDWVLQAQAAGVNVRVVNDSATFKGVGFSQAVSDEIDLLGQHNILFVTAAGNTADNNDDPMLRRYPCGYDRPTEICVTASDQNDALASFANYGPATVDLAAPGVNIYSTLRNGAYGYISGGSMASPQVAGAAALILSTGDLSTAALKAQILNNIDPVPALAGRVRTGGRLDICKAIPAGASAPVNSTPLTCRSPRSNRRRRSRSTRRSTRPSDARSARRRRTCFRSNASGDGALQPLAQRDQVDQAPADRTCGARAHRAKGGEVVAARTKRARRPAAAIRPTDAGRALSRRRRPRAAAMSRFSTHQTRPSAGMSLGTGWSVRSRYIARATSRPFRPTH